MEKHAQTVRGLRAPGACESDQGGEVLTIDGVVNLEAGPKKVFRHRQRVSGGETREVAWIQRSVSPATFWKSGEFQATVEIGVPALGRNSSSRRRAFSAVRLARTRDRHPLAAIRKAKVRPTPPQPRRSTRWRERSSSQHSATASSHPSASVLVPRSPWGETFTVLTEPDSFALASVSWQSANIVSLWGRVQFQP